MEIVTETNQNVELLPAKSEVLAIGDPQEYSFMKTNPPQRDRANFHADCKRRLAELVLGNAADMRSDESSVDSFGAESIQINSGTRHIYLQCNQPVNGCMFWMRTYDSKSLLRAVKQKLSNENWISENTMEISLKSKHNNSQELSRIESRIYKIVSDYLSEQDARILQFLCCMQRQHRK
ncbi:uncharacterized protein [Drosophila virilis]|uniref:Uncharacterized protein n=1 Tax=Drosophila virilis TaxID=7244 RepID=A0A0Q9WE73_DROVI|nr:uncharacterized protein Dvir_GJ25669 [Drosophila virilis]